MQTAEALKRVYPEINLLQDVNLVQTAAGVVIGFWNTAKLGPRPTIAELQAQADKLPPVVPPPTVEERIAKLEAAVFKP